MKQRQILINAIMSVVQVVLVGISLFVLYRFLLHTIGIEKMGVWSVVLSTATVANVANLGISAGVVRFVAKYLARGEEETVLLLVQTSTISIALFVGLGLAIAYPLVRWLISFVIPSANRGDAYSILPFGLLALWITVIAGVFQAGLDGYQRIDHRCILLISGALGFLVICFLVVPSHGLLGLAYAQVANSSLLLFLSWLMLRHHLAGLPFLPKKWNRKLFREILAYSLKYQTISVLSLFYDPITKSLISRFGGLPMAGYYDMASRMVLQVRALIVSANQALVPVVVDLQENSHLRIRQLYMDSYRLLLYISVPIYFMIMALSPIISELWIGRYVNQFVLFSIMLGSAWMINSLAAPAYFVYVGTGELRWNVIAHVTMCIVNIGLGLLLGVLYGGIGVVSAWAVALVGGSCIIVASYHGKNKISLSKLFPKESAGILAGSLVGLFLTILVHAYEHGQFTQSVNFTIIAAAYLAILSIPVWRHPMRARIAQWVRAYLLT
jgi:O-antigen/teichoic acid export membrane protein